MITNILEYLENTASKFSGKIAFSDDKKSVSYSNLVKGAKMIGTYLAERSDRVVRKPVIVFVDRNVESVVSFMGVLYSGNFYVPIDAKMPQQRVELIVKTLDPMAAITVSDSDDRVLDAIGYAGLRLDYTRVMAGSVNESILESIRLRAIDVDPLYAIFTSGSTGIPKGVVISHKSAIDLAEWLVDTFCFTSDDVLGNQTPFYFDASVKDIYITIKTGATMHIISRKYFSFPRLLVDFLNERKITSILWATSAICLVANSNILEEQPLPYLGKIFFAGEAMPAKQLNLWRMYLPNAMYVNLYGPTEITVDCTYYVVERSFEDDEFVPIGYPCKNMEILVFDENNRLVEPGGAGELCVRGTGVALGYYNNPEKTKDVFVQNPLHNLYEDKIYRTGDIVKYNQEGELLFISRKDFQVKHMGNRIELGEIEVAVNSIGRVSNAACIYDQEGQKIVLYYTTDDNMELDIINLIKDKIPKYMYPNLMYPIDKMPYNLNGKIDRLELKNRYLKINNL